MKTSFIAITVVLFTALATSRAEEKEKSDPVFKSLGEAIEEVVAYAAKAQFADSEPAGFSIGVVDYGAVPMEEFVSLSPEVRASLAKRLPKLWKNFVELDQVKFVPWRRSEKNIPDEMLPKVPKDSKGNSICFLKIVGLRFVDERTIHVSWKCTGGGPGGVAGTYAVAKDGNEWGISSVNSCDFD